ncbi:unnamed protein product [Nezara viridula]|uniref:Uncharacterized protein n=1 Tax=Nezara viridula TaxID=85310 RepID=A0A9P0MTZ7_NEZVI|nr:unnamed protein product [Nezara viridula]
MISAAWWYLGTPFTFGEDSPNFRNCNLNISVICILLHQRCTCKHLTGHATTSRDIVAAKEMEEASETVLHPQLIWYPPLLIKPSAIRANHRARNSSGSSLTALPDRGSARRMNWFYDYVEGPQELDDTLATLSPGTEVRHCHLNREANS